MDASLRLNAAVRSRIAQVRAEMEAGTYEVDIQQLAKSIVDDELARANAGSQK